LGTIALPRSMQDWLRSGKDGNIEKIQEEQDTEVFSH